MESISASYIMGIELLTDPLALSLALRRGPDRVKKSVIPSFVSRHQVKMLVNTLIRNLLDAGNNLVLVLALKERI